MTQPVPNQCPLSGGALEVTEVTCLDCGVQIRGHFALSRYESLAPEHQQFLGAFLRSRGVIRDVESVLGISYPTVKARLEALLSALGFEEDTLPPIPPSRPNDDSARRKEILAAISAGTLDADAGLRALKQLGDK